MPGKGCILEMNINLLPSYSMAPDALHPTDLVPKLQLGNPEDEAPASQDGKLELPGLNSQAGAWELADSDDTELSDYANLPKEWCLTTLSAIAEWGSGGTPSRSNPSFYGGNIPWVKTGDLGPKTLYEVNEFITEEAVKNSSAKFFPKGSVAIAMYGATIGKTSILGINATTNQACGVGNPIKGLTLTEFLYYFLGNEKARFIAKGKGGAQPNISQTLIKEHPICLPPFAEQQQIVAKLDELLAQVDILKTRLDSIPKILKRFRQSVLAAAVSGKLTEDWRFKNDISTDSWQPIKVGHLVKSIEAGKNLKCIETSPVGDQHGIIKISAVTWGFYNENESKTLPDNKLFVENRRIQIGDFLISRANTLELIGMPVIVKDVSKNLMLSDKVWRLVMNEADKTWLSIFLRSYFGRKEIESRSTGNQLSMRNIGQKIFLDITLPKPSVEEQTEIVACVEQLFTYADQIEQRVKDAQARVNHLTQAILAKAFRGELTAEWRTQNPDLISGDNSAAALLAKIKAERELTQAVKKAKK